MTKGPDTGEVLGALTVLVLMQTITGLQEEAKKNQAIARSGQDKGKVVILDTCALIDGRIVDVAKSGFLSASLIVPSSVVRELQYMADQADHLKRERARYGLDVIGELKAIDDVVVTVLEDEKPQDVTVDDQLIKLAAKHGARLYTTDFNLGKVASVEGVSVLNINELAQALRPAGLPGERITIKLVQAGQNPNQGVGYLEDGTMVVVENGKKRIGSTVDVSFTRMLQTQAGRMMFAVLADESARADKAPTPSMKSKPDHQPKNHKKPAKEHIKKVVDTPAVRKKHLHDKHHHSAAVRVDKQNAQPQQPPQKRPNHKQAENALFDAISHQD